MSRQSKTARTEKLKIGFVFDDSLDSYDGVAQYVKILGEWLTSEGHQVRYLVGQTKMTHWHGGRVYSLSKNLRVSFNKNRLSMPLFSSKRAITEVLNQEKFDVLHVQVPYSPFMAKYVILSAGPQTAVVGTFHILPSNWQASWGSRLLSAGYGKSLKRFDKVLSVSRPAAQFALRALNVRSSVLPNVIKIANFTEAKAAKASSKEKRIVFLGRLVERKGCLHLLEAFKLLHGKMPTVRLIIAGDGPQIDKLHRFVERNDLESSVEFLGFVNEDSKADLLASADVACFPSTAGESFGIVLLEAMAAGAGVVIGGDNAGYRSVLGKREELLVDPRDTGSFAVSLEKALTDKELINRSRAWQAEEVMKYDVSSIGPRVVDIYRQAIDKRRKAKHN